MKRSVLGRTGLEVSACTLGTSRAAAAGFAEAAACALAAGVNTIELDAGNAAAVEAAARLLRAARPAPVHVLARATSLVPFDLPSPHVPAQQAYPGTHLRAQVESLLRVLDLDRLGMLQLHAWCPEWLHEGDWRETCERLRAEGKIAGVGISLFDHDVDSATEAVETGAVDAVQAMFNLFDPGPAPRLLPLCAARGVAVFARAPLYHGFLVREIDRPGAFAAGDWRRDFFFPAHREETCARAAALEAAVSPEDLGSAALRFPASFPGIASVVVGMTSPAQVERNLTALAQGPLPRDTVAALLRHRWLC